MRSGLALGLDLNIKEAPKQRLGARLFPYIQ